MLSVNSIEFSVVCGEYRNLVLCVDFSVLQLFNLVLSVMSISSCVVFGEY